MKAMNLTARRGVQEESGAFKKIKKEKDIIMRPNENVTYRLESRADTSRSLNVYGTTPKSLANVCLYKSDDNDICQQWLYEKKTVMNTLSAKAILIWYWICSPVLLPLKR